MFIINWARNHPWMAGTVALITFLIVYWIFSGDDSSTAVYQSGGNSDAQLAYASQSEQIQASLAAASMNVSAQRDVALGDQATQISLANIQKDIVAGEYAVRMSEISATQQVLSLQSTLAARVAESTLTAQTQQKQIETAGSVDTTRLYTQALTKQAQISANTAAASIAAASKAASCTGWKAIIGAC